MFKDKYPSIFSPQMETIVFIILLLHNARSFENWGIFLAIPQFQLGIFGHMTCLDQSRASKKI